jgi:hypothetical protein
MHAIGTEQANVPVQRESTTLINGPEPDPTCAFIWYVRRCEGVHWPAMVIGSLGMTPASDA